MKKEYYNKLWAYILNSVECRKTCKLDFLRHFVSDCDTLNLFADKVRYTGLFLTERNDVKDLVEDWFERKLTNDEFNNIYNNWYADIKNQIEFRTGHN